MKLPARSCAASNVFVTSHTETDFEGSLFHKQAIARVLGCKPPPCNLLTGLATVTAQPSPSAPFAPLDSERFRESGRRPQQG
eukprot:1010709-Pelagomonas_calceolata.AAC.1